MAKVLVEALAVTGRRLLVASRRGGGRGRDRRTGEVANGQVGLGGQHEPPPDVGGQISAGHTVHRPIVVVAHPDAAHQLGGEADEPGVAPGLAGAGLARGGTAQRRTPAGAPGDYGLKHLHHLGVEVGVEHGAGRHGRTLIDQLAGGCGDLRHQPRFLTPAILLEHLEGARQFDQAGFVGAQRH